MLVAKPAEAPPTEAAPASGGKQKKQGKAAAAPPPPPPVLRGVAFDASGRYLLAGSEDKAAGLRLWDCATWELLQTMCGGVWGRGHALR